MASTTHLSDINELAFAYVLNGQQWWNDECRLLFNEKSRLLVRADVATQLHRARKMASVVVDYCANDSFHVVAWTGRAGSMDDLNVATPNHPADVMLRMHSDGRLFGISCKSTNGYGDIGFKNPGIGAIEKALSVELVSFAKAVELNFAEQHGLPASADKRKVALRAQPSVLALARVAGAAVLHDLRGRVLDSLHSANQAFLVSFVKQTLMDSDANTYPRYIKVTGYGNGIDTPFSAKVHDPFHVSFGDVWCEAVGSDAIGFRSGTGKLCKLRAKYESEKLASTLKFSVDPW